jgi:hypothetical protein
LRDILGIVRAVEKSIPKVFCKYWSFALKIDYAFSFWTSP